MNTATRLLAAALLLFCAVGCASSDDQQAQAQKQANADANPNASTIPWNKPQSWEGQGMLGGFDQGNQSSVGH
jgi:hypothetical protein